MWHFMRRFVQKALRPVRSWVGLEWEREVFSHHEKIDILTIDILIF